MTYSQQVQNMCPITKGPKHGPAPIPEEGAWVKAYEIKDISGYTHGVGWCAPQQGTCKLSLNIKNGVIEEALVETIGCSGMTHSAAMAGEILPGKTTIMKEYSTAYTPGSGETPYYAILEPENRELYERYLERVQNLTNFHPVGRLAEYRYYDMDAVTNSALDLSDEIIACHA